MPEPSEETELPLTEQDIEKLVGKYKGVDSYKLRVETMRRIEAHTGRPLLCYVTQTNFLPPGLPQNITAIEDSDLEGFDSLIDSHIQDGKDSVDVFFVSNGGSAEASERIVRLLRDNFSTIRFILPSNAFSAATMMSFACNSILMTDTAALGPIDPQINGIPARSILRGFEDLEKRLKDEGVEALTAYIHLLEHYSLHLLEICRSAEALSKELAREWLSQHMLNIPATDEAITAIVDHFADYDLHKSHARSIGRRQATELGLNVEHINRGDTLDRLVRSLLSQYNFFLKRTDFYKLYENSIGVGWGRRWQPENNIPANLDLKNFLQ